MSAKNVFRSLLRGLASLGRLAGERDQVRFVSLESDRPSRPHYISDDEEAMREDWRAVGRDIRQASEQFREEHSLEPA